MVKSEDVKMFGDAKVVDVSCSCEHDKAHHQEEVEVRGKPYRDGNSEITPITKKTIFGKCSVKKCKCKKLNGNLLILDNGDTVNSRNLFFCDICGRYVKIQNRVAYWPKLQCVECFKVFHMEETKRLESVITKIEELSNYLSTEYETIFEKEIEFDEDDADGDYDHDNYFSLHVSVQKIFEKSIALYRSEISKLESLL